MAHSIEHVHRKPANTPANRLQPRLGEFGMTDDGLALRELEPWAVERLCFTGAVELCICNDGRPAKALAKCLGMSKGYLSKLLNGLWSEQWGRMRAFMAETGCIAPLQRMTADLGYGIHRLDLDLTAQLATAQARIAFLTAQLEQQRRSAA